MDENKKVSYSVTTAIHQMKNPIYVLKGYLEALLNEEVGELNNKQKEYLSDSLENIDHVTDIISELLLILEIEDKEYVVKKKEVDLKKVVLEVKDNFFIFAKAANVDIQVDIPDNLPSVSTDPLKIHDVIENLITNAIKYKGQGKGKVNISLSEKDDNVLFSISDNGIGIPAEEGESVFSKFLRAKNAVDKDPTGLGLGLYISKAIVNLSGGEIWFKNNEEGGVTFYFTLPKYHE